MILIDTSVWIEFFKKSSKVDIPEDMIPRIAVCPPVIQEVLQGIKSDDVLTRIRRSLLSFNLAGKNLTVDHYAEASSIYRSARRRGITIRSSVDCLISVIAIQEKIQIWHQDRDFGEIAKFTELQIFQP
jgi:predicted nucleic acid-binding protein